MSEINDLLIIYLFLFGLLITPFIELILIIWLWIGILTVPFLWLPLYGLMFPVVYVKPRSTWNQMWT